MGARFVDQGDIGALAAPQLVAETGDKLETAGAATHHNNSMKPGAFARCHTPPSSKHSCRGGPAKFRAASVRRTILLVSAAKATASHSPGAADAACTIRDKILRCSRFQ